MVVVMLMTTMMMMMVMMIYAFVSLLLLFLLALLLFFAFLLALLWASREFGLCLLTSFWLQRLSHSGSSALAQAFWLKKNSNMKSRTEWSCQESRTLAALGQQGVWRVGPHVAATMAFLRGTSHQDSVTAAPATGGAAVCAQLPAAEIYEDSHFGSCAAVLYFGSCVYKTEQEHACSFCKPQVAALPVLPHGRWQR